MEAGKNERGIIHRRPPPARPARPIRRLQRNHSPDHSKMGSSHPAPNHWGYWLFGFCDERRCSSHSRQMASDTASTTGPMKRPTSPKASTPPSTPKTTRIRGIWVALEITSGRTTLSTQLTTTMPQTGCQMSGHHQPQTQRTPDQRRTKWNQGHQRRQRTQQYRRRDSGRPVTDT